MPSTKGSGQTTKYLKVQEMPLLGIHPTAGDKSVTRPAQTMAERTMQCQRVPV